MVFDLEDVGDNGLDFKFQINKDQFEIDHEDCSLNTDIDVNGYLFRVGDEIYFKGSLKTELVLKCSRCLDHFQHSIESKLVTHFVPKNQDSSLNGEIELHLSDIDVETYVGKRIDLTQSIRDKIFLDIPVICLCMGDCQGICQKCGVNLNKKNCVCIDDIYIILLANS